jgi:hypothetical protein
MWRWRGDGIEPERTLFWRAPIFLDFSWFLHLIFKCFCLERLPPPLLLRQCSQAILRKRRLLLFGHERAKGSDVAEKPWSLSQKSFRQQKASLVHPSCLLGLLRYGLKRCVILLIIEVGPYNSGWRLADWCYAWQSSEY